MRLFRVRGVRAISLVAISRCLLNVAVALGDGVVVINTGARCGAARITLSCSISLALAVNIIISLIARCSLNMA